MNTLRKTILVLVVIFLPIALFGFGLSWSLHQVFGTPSHVEGALTKSGIYHSVVGNALTQAQNKQQTEPNSPSSNSGDNNVPFSQPAIRSVIEQAFPPDFLQTQTNQVLDSVYGWLEGNQANLNFTIDLTSAKTSLANGIGEYAQKQLSSLPTCTAAQLPTGDVDAFTATCVPAGFNIADAAAKAKNNILNGDFLKDTQVTQATIKNGKGQTLQTQLQKAPQAYHRATLAIYALGVVAVLLSVGTILLSVTWRNGVRKLGSVYISVGAISALLSLAISFGLNKASAALAKNSTANKALQQSILDVVKILAHDLQHYWLTYGIVLLVLGIGGLVLIMVMKPKNVMPKPPKTGEEELAATPVTATPPQLAPRPPKKPKIVQG